MVIPALPQRHLERQFPYISVSRHQVEPLMDDGQGIDPARRGCLPMADFAVPVFREGAFLGPQGARRSVIQSSRVIEAFR